MSRWSDLKNKFTEKFSSSKESLSRDVEQAQQVARDPDSSFIEKA